MHTYTIVSNYYGTGNGNTISVWLGQAVSHADALEKFKNDVPGGSFFVHSAVVTPGYDWDDDIVQLLVTAKVKTQLQDPSPRQYYVAQMHFNYS